MFLGTCGDGVGATIHKREAVFSPSRGPQLFTSTFSRTARGVPGADEGALLTQGSWTLLPLGE